MKELSTPTSDRIEFPHRRHSENLKNSTSSVTFDGLAPSRVLSKSSKRTMRLIATFQVRKARNSLGKIVNLNHEWVDNFLAGVLVVIFCAVTGSRCALCHSMCYALALEPFPDKLLHACFLGCMNQRIQNRKNPSCRMH